jgi:hypothetical protein
VAVCRALGYYILGFGAGREILYNNSDSLIDIHINDPNFYIGKPG